MHRCPIRLFVLILIIIFMAGCAPRARTPEPRAKPNISANEENPAVWAKYYPRQYESYMKNNEESKTPFGGSVRDSHLDKKPYIKTLFKGYGFGEDYNEERGHVYSVTDVKETKRITEKSAASCWNCKTPTAPKQIASEGVSWYKKPFADIAKDPPSVGKGYRSPGRGSLLQRYRICGLEAPPVRYGVD